MFAFVIIVVFVLMFTNYLIPLCHLDDILQDNCNLNLEMSCHLFSKRMYLVSVYRHLNVFIGILFINVVFIEYICTTRKIEKRYCMTKENEMYKKC